GKPNPVSVYAVTFEKLGPQRELKNNVGWQPENAKDTDVCDVEDFATALIRFDNGAVIQLETSYDVHLPSSSGLSLCGEKGGMVTGGENLTMHTNINGYISDVNISKNSYKNAGKQFVKELQEFADCVQGKAICTATAEDGLIIMKILGAIYESAKTGHEVIIK
ncbi:MAG: gfo/Idh/MocA family oxidoreductase, partial [Clostridia bacterium]|nr:gfo/Idh/MocA family oxidoreductase [Clostridia bacterium]